jgi:hypothetical protein
MLAATDSRTRLYAIELCFFLSVDSGIVELGWLFHYHIVLDMVYRLGYPSSVTCSETILLVLLLFEVR